MKKFIFLFLIILIILSLLSICFAGVDLTTFNKTNLESQRALIDSVCELYFNNEFSDIEFTYNIDSYENIRSDMLSIMNNYDYSCWITGYNSYNNSSNYGNGLRFEFCTNDNFNNGTLYQFNLYYVNNGGYIRFDKSTFSNRTTSVVGTIPSPSGGRDNRYLYYLGDTYNGINNIDNVESLFNVTFTPSSLATVTNYNNQELLLYRINRSVTNWHLGYLSSNFKDTNELVIRLSPLQWVSGDNSIYDGTYASSTYYSNGVILNNNKLNLGQNGYISIPNYYIYYDNVYLLTIKYWYRGSDYTRQFAIYFKKVGEDTTINSLINNDANTGLDIGFINSIDSYLNGNLDNSSGDINNFYNSVWGNMSFSGDFFSGDLLSQIGFIDYTDNEYDLFIYRIFKKVTDAIYNDSEDIILSFNYRGNVYNISSSDLTVPSSPLKTFVTTFLTAGFIYLIIYRFHVWFVMITTVDVFSFLHSFNSDESMFL